MIVYTIKMYYSAAAERTKVKKKFNFSKCIECGKDADCGSGAGAERMRSGCGCGKYEPGLKRTLNFPFGFLFYFPIFMKADYSFT